IGATTENPSFELNNALLSRCQVFVFEKLSNNNIKNIIDRIGAQCVVGTRYIAFPRPEVIDLIVNVSDGDARVALNTIELLQQTYTDLSKLTVTDVKTVLEKVALRYDRAGEEHYNIISALHKTMRAGDVNAALYWCGRMLFAGEDPLFVMRRVVEFAAEDIGLADPPALQICIAAYQSAHFLGMPEGQYAIFEAVAYCAKAPKSRSVYNAAKLVEKDIKDTPNSPVPMHLRNAPTKLMSAKGGSAFGGKQVGYGKNIGQSNLPEHLQDKQYLK
ncbi:MAG: replication-associated recombination protein A, partial [Patescibacteria group bacterium]